MLVMKFTWAIILIYAYIYQQLITDVSAAPNPEIHEQDTSLIDMSTGLEHVVGPRNDLFNSLELCIECRTLASRSRALTTGL